MSRAGDRRAAIARRALLRAGVALLVLALPAAAPAQPEPPAEEPEPPSQESWDLVEEVRGRDQPGSEHSRLDPLAGRWAVEASWLLPGNRILETGGTAEYRWVLGGRYLRCEMVLEDAGGRIEVLTFYGYARDLGRYVAISLNDVRSSPDRAFGSYDAGSRSFLLTERERDPTTKALRVRRRILAMGGPDTHTLEIYIDPTGRAPVRIMRATFRRAPGSE